MPTRSQLSLLHVAVQRVGLDQDAYRALLASAGVASAADLTNPQFDAVMQALRGLGFVDATARRAPLGVRDAMATDAQLAKIRALWAEFTNREDDEAPLRRWIRRQFKVSDLRFVDVQLAPRVIAALRKMLARRALAAATDPARAAADVPGTAAAPGRGAIRVGRAGRTDAEALAFVDAELRARMIERGSIPHGSVRAVHRAVVAAFGAGRALSEASVRTRARQLEAAVQTGTEHGASDRAAASARAASERRAEYVEWAKQEVARHPGPSFGDVRALIDARLADATEPTGPRDRPRER